MDNQACEATPPFRLSLPSSAVATLSLSLSLSALATGWAGGDPQLCQHGHRSMFDAWRRDG